MFSSAASSSKLVSRSDHSCVFSRLMSLHSTMKPPSRVGLRLMRSQRPSAIKISLVACTSSSRRISISAASAVPCNAGSSCASGVPGLSRSGETPRKSAACALASTMPSLASTTTTPSCEHSQRVGEPRLRGAALLDLAIHHRLDVVAHDAHGGEQRAKLVGAAPRHGDVEFAGGDALGDVGRHGDRSDDAPRQAPGDERREQQRQRGAGDVELHVARDRRARALAIEEAIAGGVVHQQIDLIVDPVGVVVERVPIHVELGAVNEPLANALPGVHGALDVLGGARRANRLRTRGRDLEVLRQRNTELVDFVSKAARSFGSVAIQRRANAARMPAKSVAAARA